MHQISSIENPAARREEDERSDIQKSENSKERWYDDVDNGSDTADMNDIVDYQSDISDYEETIKKKKRPNQKVNI